MSATSCLRLGAVGPVRREDGERGQVVARCARQDVGHETVGRAAGRRIDQLVLLAPEARVDVDHALDARHARVGRQAARVVVQRADVVRVGDRAARA